tara:strand:+ start:2728 stop:6435 length:3708 start_codon:yes stop_codon:yes gene_type:complete
MLANRFRSGRVPHQHIGISSFTEDKLVLDVIGNANISGTLNVPNLTVTGVGATIEGDINARNLNIVGITTIGGLLYDGHSQSGSDGAYLRATGTGIKWTGFASVRDRQDFIATANQTSFTFAYNTNYIDVFVNGVKLAASEFTADNGTQVVLNTGCFAGDNVELISYNTGSQTNGSGGGGGATIGINTLGHSYFTHISASGIVTAAQFHGDGSNLTGINTSSGYATVSGISTLSEGLTGIPNINVGVVTATKYYGDGSSLSGVAAGIIVEEEGSNIGTATTVNFVGTAITATFSNGTATVNVGDHYARIAGVATVATNAQGLIGTPTIVVDEIVANNVSIAQTLTYEDVKNVDSVGLITARSGIRVISGGINVASGVVTATNFVGPLTGDVTGNVSGTAGSAVLAEGLANSPNISIRGLTGTGIQITGLCTASTFVGNLVGSVQGGNVNAYNGTFTNNVSAAASITATNGFYGDGSKLTNIVTTSDSAPSNPNDGSLWWKSDEGILKIYYQDVDSSQWVDASPGGGGSGGSGGGSSDLINDSTPQLGGNLDLNNYDVSGIGDFNITGSGTFTGNGTFNNTLTVGTHAGIGSLSVTGVSTFSDNVNLPDEKKILIGDSDDMEIYHDSANRSGIRYTNPEFRLLGTSGSSSIILGQSNSSSELSFGARYAQFNNNGSVDLFYNGDEKIRTTESGVNVSGAVTATYFYGNGSALTDIYAAPPAGISTTGYSGFTNVYCAGTLDVDKQASFDDVIVSAAATFQGALTANTGPVTLNNTTANGNTDITGISTFRNDVTFTGSSANIKWNESLNRLDFPVSTSLAFGNGAELRIYNDGDNRIKGGTGGIFIGQNGSFWVGNEAHNSARFEATSSSAILYSGGTKIARSYTDKFEVGNPDAGVGIAITMSIAGNAQFGGTGIVTATTLDISGNISGGSVSGGSSVTATEFYGDISNATSYPYTSLTGISTDIVGDTTPQLGGNLDVNNKNIEIGDCTTAGTDNTLKIGSNGLELHHRPGAFATYIQNKNKDTNLWITGQNTSGSWGHIFLRPYLNAFSGVACWWGGATELYYGNTGSKKLETTSGGVTITGTLSKSGGSFKIPHPVAGLSTTKHLVHSFLEGPQMDLIYRGKIDLVDGTATVNIDTKAGMTEGTFVLLNRDIQCFTSNETGWTAVKGSVSGNILTITAQDNTCTDTISWMVVGERQDDTVKSLDMTDSEGNLIVEPDQPAPDTKHADIQAQL